jgi:hypothetical protein
MDLHLTDEQVALLVTDLDRIIENDRFPLSPHIRALREIRALLKPYPVRPPPGAPPQKPYGPPSRKSPVQKKSKFWIPPMPDWSKGKM